MKVARLSLNDFHTTNFGILCMNVNDVPQDNGIIEDHGLEICYATNEKGQYKLTHSSGWDVKNIVNDQAWELIFNKIKKAHDRVINNKQSPLAYHMEKNQMDPGLLGKYVSMARWRVRRHLKPHIFKRLSVSILSSYAQVFNISIDELKIVPQKISIETIKND